MKKREDVVGFLFQMPPKKRRQQHNKENEDQNPSAATPDPLSIETILVRSTFDSFSCPFDSSVQNENLQQFEMNFNDEYRACEKRIEEKLKDVHREFEKFIQTHESQNKLARLLDQEITRIHQEQGTKTSSPCQELMEKTTDLMNAVSTTLDLLLAMTSFRLSQKGSKEGSFYFVVVQSAAETSRTKTYLIGELQQLPMKIGNEEKQALPHQERKEANPLAIISKCFVFLSLNVRLSCRIC